MVGGIAVKWTEEQIERAGQMIRDGKTFSETAKVLKTTRSAIASLCKRKNLREVPLTNSERLARMPSRKKKLPPPNVIVVQEPSQSGTTNGAGRAVLSLKAHSCRWPIGDPRDARFRFCEKMRDVGVPYCAHHQSMSRVPKKP